MVTTLNTVSVLSLCFLLKRDILNDLDFCLLVFFKTQHSLVSSRKKYALLFAVVSRLHKNIILSVFQEKKD